MVCFMQQYKADPVILVYMPTTRQKLIKKLDQVFSQWVRSSAADHAGNVSCYTCGLTQNWRKMDAGHFQSRGKFSTRWDPMNVKPQCKRCNGFRSGEQFKFARHLDEEYGPGTAMELEAKSNQTAKHSVSDLRDLIDKYRGLLKT